MKYKEAKIELFQASSFNVDDEGAFIANKDIKHTLRVMSFYRLPYRSKSGGFSISLPPNAFHVSAFDDDKYKVDRERFLGVVDAIEKHIVEDEECNFTYVNLKHGEFVDTYTGVIKKGETVTGGSHCSRSTEY
jgi:hypothetical protein